MTQASRDREHDIVLFGATGFVGKLTAAYLAEQAPPQTRIALAGRSEDKVRAVRDSLGPAAADWGIEVVDAADSAALTELAARSRVIASTVGPYAKYGLPLVAACAAEGTHYADLTGEVLFVRRAIDASHEQAVETGAKIVVSCGFDSIPSDLGVLALADRVRADGQGELGETVLHVRSLRGGFSGGTIDSARNQAIEVSADPSLRKIVGDSYSLSPDRTMEPPSRSRTTGTTAADQPSGLSSVVGKATRTLGLSQSDGLWSAPFFMAAHNTRIVRRSNALSGYAYGREFRYSEVMDTGSGPTGLLKAGATSGTLAALFTGLSLGPTRAVLDRFLPAPGEGPSEEDQAKGRFIFDIETTTTSGAHYVARVSARKDPGYSGTAVMLGESALCLAFDELPVRGGVLTPATAMGQPLIERLRAQEFVFDVSERSPEPPAAELSVRD